MKDTIKRILKANKIVYTLLLKIYNIYVYKRNYFRVKGIVKNRVKTSKRKNTQSMYFLMNIRHGNLGDQAIGYAEQKFIKDSLKEVNVICIYEDEYIQLKNYTLEL